MWSEMTVSALINGTGIIVYSLCNNCASTIQIQEGRYWSKFCDKCNKRTFAMKYPGHVEKFPLTFYDLNKETDGKKFEEPPMERQWHEMVPCTITGRGAVVSVVLGGCCKSSVCVNNGELSYSFCHDCQKRTTWGKYPKPFKSTTSSSST